MTISFLYQMQDQIWNLHYEPSVFPFAFVFYVYFRHLQTAGIPENDVSIFCIPLSRLVWQTLYIKMQKCKQMK